MRISDWSSNVCSSDLPCDGGDRDRAHLIELGLVVRADYAIFANRELWKGVTLRRILPSDAIFEHIVLLEIGRASCRERVCQSVLVTREAVTLERQNDTSFNTHCKHIIEV